MKKQYIVIGVIMLILLIVGIIWYHNKKLLSKPVIDASFANKNLGTTASNAPKPNEDTNVRVS